MTANVDARTKMQDVCDFRKYPIPRNKSEALRSLLTVDS